MRERIEAKRKTFRSDIDAERILSVEKETQQHRERLEEDVRDDQPLDSKTKRSRIDSLAPRSRVSAAVELPSRQIQVQDKELLTRWDQRRQEYKERKRLGGHREKDTMAKLDLFMSKLKSKKQAVNGSAGGGEDVAPMKSVEEAVIEGGDTPAVADGYDGKVDQKIDHRAYTPAAWRLGTYLGVEDDDLDALRGHRLEFAGTSDPMARTQNEHDYVVHDPLLEKGKAKFNKQQQRMKKRGNEWAGRSRD